MNTPKLHHLLFTAATPPHMMPYLRDYSWSGQFCGKDVSFGTDHVNMLFQKMMQHQYKKSLTELSFYHPDWANDNISKMKSFNARHTALRMTSHHFLFYTYPSNVTQEFCDCIRNADCSFQDVEAIQNIPVRSNGWNKAPESLLSLWICGEPAPKRKAFRIIQQHLI